ncbi:helix-turn-helix domain-containing protein [Haloferula sp.]|uniref:helix-turn-helix domain-containing protein n=1 Tax=Haloferula sp. TaxID=2497595 RepID=UPI003AF52B03
MSRWLPLKKASIYSGLSARTLQNYIRKGLIKSSNVIAPGSSRGRRLIDRESLDAFIEAGVNRSATKLNMNSIRGDSPAA